MKQERIEYALLTGVILIMFFVCSLQNCSVPEASCPMLRRRWLELKLGLLSESVNSAR